MAETDATKNPIIANMPEDTISNVTNILSYLAYVDAAGEHPLPMEERPQMGRLLMLDCCTTALDRALGQVSKLREEGANARRAIGGEAAAALRSAGSIGGGL